VLILLSLLGLLAFYLFRRSHPFGSHLIGGKGDSDNTEHSAIGSKGGTDDTD